MEVPKNPRDETHVFTFSEKSIRMILMGHFLTSCEGLFPEDMEANSTITPPGQNQSEYTVEIYLRPDPGACAAT